MIVDMDYIPPVGIVVTTDHVYDVELKNKMVSFSQEYSSTILQCPLCFGPFAHTQGDVFIELKNTRTVGGKGLEADEGDMFLEFVCGSCGLRGFISQSRIQLKKGKPKIKSK